MVRHLASANPASTACYALGMPVPWVQIIQWVPPIVELSRDLLQQTKRIAGASPPASGADADVVARIAALEENERRQAELVNRMAEHQAQLSSAIVALHERARRLTVVIIVAAVAIVIAMGALAIAIRSA